MRPLFLLLLSLIFAFGDADPVEFELPASVRKCTQVEVDSCNGKVCRIDFDGMKHCVTGAQDTWVVYPDDPTSNNSQSVKLDGYLDNNNPDNTLNQQDKFIRIFGDMDVIGASVIMPRLLGYDFDPKPSVGGSDSIAQTSQVIEKVYVNEESDLGSRKFKNSSRATFKFEDKSEFERKNIDGKRIKYARLYWGGAIYSERTSKDQLLNNLFEDIFGYSRVRFKTPKGTHTVQAEYKDIKWESSFTSYNVNSVPRDTYYPYCRNPNNRDDINWCGDPSGKYTEAIHYDTADPNKKAQRSTVGARSGASYFVYQASADVTDIVKASLGDATTGDAGRTFAVGSIASTIFKTSKNDGYKVTISNETRTLSLSHGAVLYADGGWIYSYVPSQFGGWSLVIVYDFGDDGEANGIKPKAVNIYRGMANISPATKKSSSIGQTTQKSELNLKFKDFFTPSTGTVNSSLAFLGFGGRKELAIEDIVIKKKGGSYESLFRTPSSPTDELPNYGNLKHNQFDSSITRFGKLDNEKRKYNNQMDLDIFDISNFMSNKQSEVDIKFKVNALKINDNTQGDRLNLGMVGFSTILYDPEVCYDEKIYISRDGNASKFPEKIDENKTTTVQSGMLLKVITTIKNKGNEDANKVLVKVDLNRKFMNYVDKTGCMEIFKPDGTTRACPMDDNGAHFFKKLSSNELRFYVGQGATSSQGGKLEKSSKYPTDIRFIGSINSEYQKIEYAAEYESTIGGEVIKYKGMIKECTPKNYKIKIVNEKENDFYPRSKKNDPNGEFKNRLFTKIASKPFDITISNYNKTGNKELKAPDSDTKVTMELVENCSDKNGVKFLEGNVEKNQVDYDFKTTTHTLTKNITVPRPYENLHVRLTYDNKITGQSDAKCREFDSFVVRPASLQLYDRSANNGLGAIYKSNATLIGGKNYTNITLAAYNEDNKTLANGYINTLRGYRSSEISTDKPLDEVALLPVDKAGCVIESSLKEKFDNELQIVFDDPNEAVANIAIKRGEGEGSSYSEGFSYSDVGEAKFSVTDKSYTVIDQKNEDCVLNSTSNKEDRDGKIGCNIKFGEENFGFDPEYLDVSDFEIIPSDFSYISNDETAWSPTLHFKVKAKLSNDNISPASSSKPSSDNTAQLFIDGCYARSARFKIKAGDIIANYTDNNGSKLSNDEAGVEKLNSEIMFFGSSDTNALVRKVNPSPHDGVYEVKKEAFTSNGAAEVNIKFNFKREKNVAKNPFEVTSDIFTFVKPTEQGSDTLNTFENLVEDKNGANKIYTKPTKKTSAKFYYARTYAPYYEGLNTGFKAKIYYGVYCNGCDESKFMLQNIGSSERWSEFAGTHSWYINPLHSSAYGDVGRYEFLNETIRDNSKETALSNGVSYIFVKNKRAVTDVAKMHTEDWLIYNEFDKEAKTNDFNLRFLVPDGDWAGKTLGKNSNSGDVGNVLGAEENFTDISKNTNRRISW